MWEKLKTVSSLGWHRFQGVRYSFMQLWKMVLSSIVYRLAAFIQRGFDVKKVPRMRLDELELWNCFSYYPSISTYDILLGQSGKYIGKDKKWYHGTYLFTVDWAHPESNIVDTDHSEIPART